SARARVGSGVQAPPMREASQTWIWGGSMDTWVWIAIALGVVVLVAAAFAISRRRHTQLRERFGPEYDRTVATSESRRQAERDLRERAARHDELDLRPLSRVDRERYEEEWAELQGRFVDRPQIAVADADELVKDVMRTCGYPVRDFEANADLISAGHPDVVTNYRTAHAIYLKTIEGDATTEDLRQAVVAYRALFRELTKDSA